MFISVFVDTLKQTHHGIRYYLNQTNYTENVKYLSRGPSANYKVSGATQVFWGGDGRYSTCNCHIQFMRLYLNWVADSRDQLINLALMEDDGILLQV